MAGHEDRRPAPPDDFPLHPCPTTEAVVWRVHDDEALFWANVNIAPAPREHQDCMEVRR